MRTFSKPSEAIKWSKEKLFDCGYEVKASTWQSVSAPDSMWEILNHSFQFFIPETIESLVEEIRPNLPWANEHFDERVGGFPFNPPPSHERWPFAQKNNAQFGGTTKFSHTYPERIWPKHANALTSSLEELKLEIKKDCNTYPRKGIRYNYGDFEDVADLLKKEPFTRQAFLPIWFPEDTGSVHGERVPCTIGYHFIRRDDRMHVVYYIRSCDLVRHFRDDIYMACRKVFWLLEKLQLKDKFNWIDVKPGYFTMHITSLHCFTKEKGILKLNKT